MHSNSSWIDYVTSAQIILSYTSFLLMMAEASKNGVAQEAVQNIKRASKTMTETEARQILGVTENSSWEEIVQVNDLSYLMLLFAYA